MALFGTFCAALLVFTVLLIRLNKLSERRRGVSKEDGMVGEEMRWAEGREVVEKRVVRVREGGEGLQPASRKGGKTLRRQSRGQRDGSR